MTVKSDALHLIEQCLIFIEKNLDQPVTSDDVFRVLAISKSAFTPLFKAVTGYTLSQYIRNRRLSEIADQCQSPGSSAYQIAQTYQYESCEAFYRAFKRYFGMSVRQYRASRFQSQLFAPLKYSVIHQKGTSMIQKEMNLEAITSAITQQTGSVLIDVDIDHFQKINDTYGYAIGDAVLAQTLLIIQQVCKRYEHVQGPWRYGNDEFLLIAKDSAKQITADILKAFELPLAIADQLIPVSISIGTAIIGDQSIRRVQESMFTAKKHGRKQAETSSIDVSDRKVSNN